MVHLVTNRPHEYSDITLENFVISSLTDFISWTNAYKVFQLDTETLYVEDSADVNEERKLVLIQIGDIHKSNQWLIESNVFLTTEFIDFAKIFFQDEDNAFITHNGMFEYIVIKIALGVRVENIHDTFIMSKILNTGYELYDGYHGLSGCVKRFCGIDLSKEEQTNFTFAPLTAAQIDYAANDVLYLYDLFVQLKPLLVSWDLWSLYVKVERHVIKVYGDMTINQMNFDVEYWNKMSGTLVEEDAKIEAELNAEIFKDIKLVEYLKKSNLVIGSYLIQPKDSVDINWASNTTRKDILVKIIPDLVSLDKFTKPELKRFWQSNTLTVKENKLLELYLKQDFVKLNRYLKINYKNWLHKAGYLKRKNDVLINWSSNPHKLYIFQFYYPNLTDTNAKTLNRIYTNPLINKFKKYVKVHKNVTTYGSGFIKKYVSRNGTISPKNCNSILTTGRISFGILLQMPQAAQYRNPITPHNKDWLFVDSDYVSAELAIMAYASGEESLLDVVRTGKDAHMFVAQKLFPEEWSNASEEGCIQIVTGKRCSCPGHETLRKAGKAFNFGIPYGMTHVGLAERLDKSRTEAKDMLDNYFKTFPALSNFFDEAENYSIVHNHIVGLPPTKRIRFFHPPANEGEKQAIGREGKNLRIQECNASMMKIALIKLRRYIIENNFPARLNLPVHDEILSSCHKDVVLEWKEIQERAMQQAADLFLEPGLLKTDTKISELWTK